MARKTLLALTFVALCASPAQVVALADTVSTAAALTKMEQSDLGRVRPCQMMKMNGDGFVGKVGNMSYAIRCFSVGGQLASCDIMALEAATLLDLERTGQSTFAALTNKLENESGTRPENTKCLRLAESAPANMSPDQLGRNVDRRSGPSGTARCCSIERAGCSPRSLYVRLHSAREISIVRIRSESEAR